MLTVLFIPFGVVCLYVICCVFLFYGFIDFGLFVFDCFDSLLWVIVKGFLSIYWYCYSCAITTVVWVLVF